MKPPILWFVVLTLTFVLIVPAISVAITINVNGALGDLDGNADMGNGEAAVLAIAVEYWERRITTNRTFELDVVPTGLTGARGQGFVDGLDGADIPDEGEIRIDNDGSTTWYVDPNPRDSLEFAPSGTSEWRYDTGPAGSDLLRVLVHEIGHALGWICGEDSGCTGFDNPLYEDLMNPPPGMFVSAPTCAPPFPLAGQPPLAGCVFLTANMPLPALNVSLRGDGLGGSGSSVVNELSHPGVREDLMIGIGVGGGIRELMSFVDVNMFFHAYGDGVDLPAVAGAGMDIVSECNAVGGSNVTLDGSTSSDPENGAISFAWSCPGVALSNPAVVDPEGFFLLDTTTTCRLDATDLPNLDSDADTVDVSVIDTTSPDLTCPEPIVLECTDTGGTPATDPAIAAFLGGATANDVCDASLSIGNDAPAFFDLGPTNVVFSTADDSGNDNSCSAEVNIVDTTPPDIVALEASPSQLWPPNHKMHSVALSVTVDDVCDSAPLCQISSVSSNEPVNGTGDGNTDSDWMVTGDLTLDVRAERSGRGSNRVYTVEVTCTDGSGNSSTETTTVSVAHDRRM